jgi:hypothetical protein
MTADRTDVGAVDCPASKTLVLLSPRRGLCDVNYGRAAYLTAVLAPYNAWLKRLQTTGCPIQCVVLPCARVW